MWINSSTVLRDFRHQFQVGWRKVKKLRGYKDRPGWTRLFMELSTAVVWTCLLGIQLALVLPTAVTVTSSKVTPQPPRLINCVFLNRANVTCRWEAGNTPTTHYTLLIEKRSGLNHSSIVNIMTCNTSDTNCTAKLSGSDVRFTFCISVIAHGRSGDVSSRPRCQSGRIEVMLPPVMLHSVKMVHGRPQCLEITWSRTTNVPVSDSEIKAGLLNSQIKFTAQEQLDVLVKNWTVKGYSAVVCLFRPDTLYTISLRHRYQGPESPWSLWSDSRQGRTAEDAPSAAPTLWRKVKPADSNGRRLLSLLWKPLPHFLANGRVLYYNVTCQTESAQIPNNHGSCRDLNHLSTSCTFPLPAERCSCDLTASTSAGTSPEARIWLLGASETEPLAPGQITTRPLDDNNIDVSWTPPVDRSMSGFVVEWFAVREKNVSVLHWEVLNSSCTTLVITEGIKPMELYSVAVRALYGERGAGNSAGRHIYTRQGAPSAGPKVEVQQISGGTVKLSWRPVPVELLHGFIRNYSIHYGTVNQPSRNVFVLGHIHRYSLTNLSPGAYTICIRANTDAGTGAAGPTANVHIGSEEASVAVYIILPLMLTSLGLVLMVCLTQCNIVKQKLCQFVPDPSNSSLAQWSPKRNLKNTKPTPGPEKPEIKYSETILFCDDELQSSDLHRASSYQSVCNLHIYHYHCYSPLPASGSQTLQNTRASGEKFTRTSIINTTTSSTDLFPGASIYSNVVFTQTHENPPSPSQRQHDKRQQITVSTSDHQLQLGGDTRSPSPVSFQVFPLPAELNSPKHLFSQSNFESSLQPDTFSHPNSPSLPIFVDFSYCPVTCDPYISSCDA